MRDLKRLLAGCPEGPRIEMGVHNGASLKVIADHPGSTIGVDSFAGMPEPTVRDIKDGWNPYPNGRLASAMPGVAARVPKARLIQGYVPAVLPDLPEGPYAFAYLDMDQYDSTLAALNWLWSRMLAGGVIACDDWFNDRDWLAGGAINAFAVEHPLDGTAGRLAWFVR